MKTTAKFFIPLLSLLFIAASCSTEDDANGSEAITRDLSIASRAVKFEVTGNFSGSLFATCSLPDDSNVLRDEEGVLALPWTKEFTTVPGTDAAKILAGGAGGAAGQTITVKIYVNGAVKYEKTAVANSAGNIVSGGQYIF
ncbi:MAG TPA: MmpS family transport accessory protein [Flavobacterium sp.]|nr:MmpS family transport accessory protein [Flavobacterium sp.]